MIRLAQALMASICLNSFCADKGSTDRLVDHSDAVVVGEAQSTRQLGLSITFFLLVDRSIKGDLAKGSIIPVSWTSGFQGGGDLGTHYGLFYLQKTPEGRWTLLPPAQGRIWINRAYLPLSRKNAPADVPANEKPRTAAEGIGAELAVAVEHYANWDELERLASALFGVADRTVTRGIYAKLSSSADPELKFIGLAGLAGSGDASALDELARNIALIPNLKTSRLPLGTIAAVLDASPQKIAALGRIASFPNPVVQRSAAEALRDIHTRDTVPFLAILLDSADPRAREAAMMGLSRFVDNLPMDTAENVRTLNALIPQGPAPYRTHDTDRYSLSRSWLDQSKEAAYLQFWKSWWARMKADFGSGR